MRKIKFKVKVKLNYSMSLYGIEPTLILGFGLKLAALRAALQAFRREEELQFNRSSKRKRERFDQVCHFRVLELAIPKVRMIALEAC